MGRPSGYNFGFKSLLCNWYPNKDCLQMWVGWVSHKQAKRNIPRAANIQMLEDEVFNEMVLLNFSHTSFTMMCLT